MVTKKSVEAKKSGFFGKNLQNQEDIGKIAVKEGKIEFRNRVKERDQ